MNSLTPMERSRLERLLSEARQARHEILIGQSVRTLVDQNGERIEYSGANLQRLEAYIASLEAQLGLCGRNRGPRPVEFFF